MKEKARSMVLASFAADSLALGAHWIYDTDEIQQRLGRVERLLKPLPTSYHPGKDKGELTHYGDQTYVLLKSVADGPGFDLGAFALAWRELFRGYNGYFDKATKATLANFDQGKPPSESGSMSSDLAGAVRIAPLAYRYRNSVDELVFCARAQTAMTHNNPAVIEGAGLLARIVWKVLMGSAPASAFKEEAAEAPAGSPFARWIEDGLESAGTPTPKAVSTFGQSCDVRGALPSVVHLVAKYEDNLKEALVENVMAGGDSAARGMAVGMILGAHLGMEAIPAEWLSELKRYGDIAVLLDTIDGQL